MKGQIPTDIDIYFNDWVRKQYSIVTELHRKSLNRWDNQETGWNT